jgi:D-sedoheptulose 7-phosphate isomerase
VSALNHLRVVLDDLEAELKFSFGPALAMLSSALKDGHKILLCGNGGSAAQASHMATELVVRYRTDRAALPAISLSSDCGVITAASNDYGYERVFSRQIEALGDPEDVLVSLSTSGRSRNVLEAIATARHRGLGTIGVSGKVGLGCDVDIRVPSADTARVQEATLLVCHMLCEALET